MLLGPHFSPEFPCLPESWQAPTLAHNVGALAKSIANVGELLELSLLGVLEEISGAHFCGGLSQCAPSFRIRPAVSPFSIY